MERHAPSFPLIFGTRQARHCDSDDNAKIAPELCCLKVRCQIFTAGQTTQNQLPLSVLEPPGSIPAWPFCLGVRSALNLRGGPRDRPARLRAISEHGLAS